MMEDQEEKGNAENGIGRQKQVKDEYLLQFLDSLDGYLTLLDSLSSTLSQGWLELASARHAMGASRINGALLDLKVHAAATSLKVSEQDVDSMESQPCFTLCKWASSDNGERSSGEEKSLSPQLRHRNNSQLSGIISSPQRQKSLSVFGVLVSPKLRSAQLSFERALETLVEIANLHTTMLSMFEQVHKELENTNG
ncbi:coiled-coil domain-containing protein 115 [Citrus sinensis]|uniref:Coiled-coil domain-containing protein 115 n=1 Tax=Citrus sinensis TaxID=2711 RepID=A0ACB8KYU5_CITSI|nr:coiled-coil domain-containing protein 115 isoform X3 [Citrus x clementina]KAH9693930.1 coiled-coil domain-containing protein 115 [Citrus sinensis]KAH9759637.1 coiled-coil domain-containing protein 115 [Citrus sinensis]